MTRRTGRGVDSFGAAADDHQCESGSISAWAAVGYRHGEKRMMTRFVKACAAFGIAMGISTAALADQHEGCEVDPEKLESVGTVKGSMNGVGFIAGVRWGDGVLTLNDGTERTFKVPGLELLETGGAANDFGGEVYIIKAQKDFEGTYYGASARISVIASKGEGVLCLVERHAHALPHPREGRAALQ